MIDTSKDTPTPADLVRAVAVADPGRLAIVGPTRSFTYRGLADVTDCVASGLAERGIERFACVSSDPVTVAIMLVAASATGAEACAYPASVDTRELQRLRESFAHDVLVSDGTVDLDAELVTTDDLASEPGASPANEHRGVAPVLILTTGTTGLPKGARHDWRRLVRAAGRWSSPAGSRWLLAYNLNQFAGVQVLLHVLVSGASVVVPDRLQPRYALATMVEHDVTRVSATPTFWRHLLSQMNDDTPVPSLEQITIGGERVPEGLLPDLRARFPGARVSQVYASTEFGSGAAVQDSAAGLPLSVLERGPDADVQMRIVDGELHVRSRVGMLGYHGQDDADDGWRPTGDLVEVRGNRIHFVGRSAEIINVGGVKVHPATVEDRVMEVAGVVNAHARGRSNPVAGQIVMVDVVAADNADTDDLDEQIRKACAGLPEAAQPRRIRFVDELEVREHKVRRGGDPV